MICRVLYISGVVWDFWTINSMDGCSCCMKTWDRNFGKLNEILAPRKQRMKTWGWSSVTKNHRTWSSSFRGQKVVGIRHGLLFWLQKISQQRHVWSGNRPLWSVFSQFVWRMIVFKQEIQRKKCNTDWLIFRAMTWHEHTEVNQQKILACRFLNFWCFLPIFFGGQKRPLGGEDIYLGTPLMVGLRHGYTGWWKKLWCLASSCLQGDFIWKRTAGTWKDPSC